ncbi:hypothetical protein KSP39_PZI016369 [Platanthera zijinensis]|uniref:Uncharacterized protein n=1 Tax=Platanthera zijinensis TaxID=2320716 RepID=A0AAP0B8T5_9ASPA
MGLTMEDKWIELLGCLLLGKRLNAGSFEILATRLSSCLNSNCDFKANDNFIRAILSGS